MNVAWCVSYDVRCVLFVACCVLRAVSYLLILLLLVALVGTVLL